MDSPNGTDPDAGPALDDLADIEDIEDLEDGPDDLDTSEDDEIGDADGPDEQLDPVILAGTTNDLVELKPAEAVVTPAEADTADDDVLITDEVEASLDVILAERMRARDVDVDEEPDDQEADDSPNQLATAIPVRRPDEFLCQSCFLLKSPGQMADRAHQLCRDCA